MNQSPFTNHHSPIHPFHGLDGRSRSEKPRTTGLTMVADWGIGPHAQSDLLTTGATFFDLAKIAVGISRLLPDDVLRNKISIYRQHQVEPFPGGQYLEYAEGEGKTDQYLSAVVEAGYKWVEVSDNMATVTLQWKLDMIRKATEASNLIVLGEVGQKEGLQTVVPMGDDAQACLDAGAQVILLEAAELIGDDPAVAKAVEAVIQRIGLDKVMFELPGPWIEGVTHESIHRMRRQLVDQYGPDVNIGNVEPSDLISLEAYRLGLGVNAGQKSP